MRESDESGIEFFMTGSLARQCGILLKLLSGKDAAGSTKNVHKLRVVCRRIRSILKVSQALMPEKKRLKRLEDIKQLACSLGSLRDADVRIDYVKNFLKAIPADKQPTLNAGYLRLLSELKRGRKALKLEADEKIKQFVDSKTMSKFVRLYANKTEPCPMHQDKEVQSRLWLQCCQQFRGRAEKILSRVDCLSDPSDIQGLHKLRIAFKKLRYIVRIYRDIFGNRLDDILSVLKKFQSLLGDIHDCDEWDRYLKSFIKEEKRLSLDLYGNLEKFAEYKVGFEHFRRHIRRERKRLFEQFMDMWEQSDERQVWEKFLVSIEK